MKPSSPDDSVPIDNGTVDEFVRAVEEMKKPLKDCINRKVHDEHDTEDILQETVFRAWRYLGNLRDETKFNAWIGRIARNRAKSHSQKKRVRKRTLIQFSKNLEELADKTPVVADPELDPASICEKNDLLRAIKESIQELPEDCREIYFWYFMSNHSLEGLAEKFDLHVNTIRKHVRKAEDFLKRHFR